MATSSAAAAASTLNWISQPDRDGRTVLYKAVAYHALPLVQCLLDYGADDGHAERTWGCTSLHEAIFKIDFSDRINSGMMELVPLLLKNQQQQKSIDFHQASYAPQKQMGPVRLENKMSKMSKANRRKCCG